MQRRMSQLLPGLKAERSCRYDIVSLGEVMLRLDPGEGRIHTARTLNAWEGGGEYNVARGLRRCFNQRAAIVTALADNPIGRLVEDFMLQGGLDTSAVVWKPYDGVGRRTRNGLNFTERGFGPRAGLGCSDRGHTAISQIQVKDVNWGSVFTEDGGIQSFPSRRYILKSCMWIKIDVEFDIPQGAKQVLSLANVRIKKVSKPYLEQMILD